MPKIAAKLGFQAGAMVEARKDNESVPVCAVKLRCFTVFADKSCMKHQKILVILGVI